MLMIIFGAGASFDSSQKHRPKPMANERALSPVRFVDDYPEVLRPPLTNELFQRLEFNQFATKLPRLNGVHGQLQNLPTGSLEAELQEMDTFGARNPLRAQQLAAFRYYVLFLLSIVPDRWLQAIGGASNYGALLGQIRDYDDEPVCLVTFNYDLLLEKALGWEVQRIEDYIRSDWRLIKVHGSVNWARQIRAPQIDHRHHSPWETANQIVDAAPALEFGEGYTIISFVSQYPEKLLELPVGKPDRHEDPALFPAIAIPLPGKLGPECPPLLLDALRESLPQITKLLVIGWAGMEDHFLQILTRDGLSPGVSGLVVNGSESSSQGAIQHMRASGLGARLLPSPHGFTDFVRTRELGRLYG